jgi:spoIIIJ-associated protein
MAKKKEQDKIARAKELSTELLGLMGTSAEVKVSEDKENEAIVVDIATEEERGLLIGHHGDTLNAIQSAIGIMLRRELGEWVRVVVNVGDWRERQEEQLKKLALDVAERAKQTGEAQPLYNLTPAQRRIVHLELSKYPDVSTESTGEGAERYLVVKPKG